MYPLGVIGEAPDPAGFLQAVGHPLRWRLLAELGRSDRTVGELVDRVDEPQNLVSYHLAKLRGAGLVTSRRSSADGRDAYYAAELGRLRDQLSQVGGALHPGLRLVAPALGDVAAGASVLFVCTGNSARSQIAEAFARRRSAGAVDACSAGSRPKPIHPNAVRVLREDHGIDLSAHTSTDLDEVVDRRFDVVVTLCDRVREVCPDLPGSPRAVHWSVADPAVGGDDDATYPAFRRLAAELATRVEYLLAELARPVADPDADPGGPTAAARTTGGAPWTTTSS